MVSNNTIIEENDYVEDNTNLNPMEAPNDSNETDKTPSSSADYNRQREHETKQMRERQRRQAEIDNQEELERRRLRKSASADLTNQSSSKDFDKMAQKIIERCLQELTVKDLKAYNPKTRPLTRIE